MADYNLGTARGKIEIDSSGAVKGTAQAANSVDDFKKRSGAASASLIKVGGAMAAVGGAAVLGFGLAVNASANFEKRISAIGAVTGTAGKDLDELRQKALQLGKDTQFSAGEAATAIEELAKAGIPVKEILGGAAAAVTDLAAAGEVDLTNAATIVSNSMNAFGISGEKAAHVADVFASAANSSAADVDTLGQSLSQVQAVASLVGLGFEDTVAALSLFADVGLKGSDAGTSLKTMLLNLQPATNKQKKLFDDLGITVDGANNKFFDQQGKLRTLAELQKVLQDATQGMTAAQKLATLEQIGGTDAVRAFGILTETGSEKLKKYRADLDKQGTAQEVAKKKMDNLKGSLEQFKGSLETAAIAIGKFGQGPVRAVIDFVTKLLNGFLNLSPGMQQLIITVALITAALIGLAGVFVMSVGAAMKLVVAYRQFKAAIAFVKTIGLVQKAMTALNASFLANPVFLVIAAIVALGIALFIAYKKIKPFREFVDRLWQSFQRGWDIVLGGARAVVAFFQRNWQVIGAVLLAPIAPLIAVALAFFRFRKAIFNAIGGIVNFIKSNWDLLLPIFLGPVGAIILIWRRFGDTIMEIGGKVVDAIVGFFTRLPGMVLGLISSFIGAAIGIIAQLPEKIAFFIGYMIGLWLTLPGKIAGVLVSVVGAILGFVGRMAAAGLSLAAGLVTSFINFLLGLPGRIAGALVAAVGAVLGFAGRMLSAGTRLGKEIVTGIAEALKEIPAIIGRALVSAAGALAKGAAGLAKGAVGAGKSLVGGFKKAVFGSPHTKIEYWVWDMVDNVTKSTADLSKVVRNWAPAVNLAAPTDPKISLQVAQGAGVVSSASTSAASAAPASSAPAIGQLVVNNPAKEETEESLLKTGQKLTYLGAFE